MWRKKHDDTTFSEKVIASEQSKRDTIMCTNSSWYGIYICMEVYVA